MQDDMGWVNADNLSEDDPLANTYGAFAGRIDVDRVDLNKYPGWSQVDYYHAEMEAGDCLFLPAFWLHQVRSEGRNLAVNVWLHKLPEKDASFDDTEQACNDDSISDTATGMDDVTTWSMMRVKNTQEFLEMHPDGQRKLWKTITEVYPALAERAQAVFRL